MYGTAGTLLGLLALHAVTGDSKLMAEAGTAGDQLVAAALDAPEGADGCYWEVISATPGGPVIPYLGLLHGSAGIALALAHLGRVTGDERFLLTATRAAELLLAQATSSATSVPARRPMRTRCSLGSPGRGTWATRRRACRRTATAQGVSLSSSSASTVSSPTAATARLPTLPLARSRRNAEQRRDPESATV